MCVVRKSVNMTLRRVALLLSVLYFVTLFNGASLKDRKYKDFLLVTVATNQTDGFQRFLRSAKVYNIPVKVLGLGEKWEGGDVRSHAGGGHKINLLKKELLEHKDDPDKVILFTDSYDVILLSGPDKIVQQFERFDARVVFSAEGFCWPDEGLASKYPAVQRGKRYLNSGGFIGYAPELYNVVTSTAVANDDDDQLFYTKVYLNEELRDKFRIKLDHRSDIFQNLNGAIADVELMFRGQEAYLQNTVYSTAPLVIHGNGPSKLVLNTLGNYLANSWNPEDGCLSCWDDSVVLEDKDPKSYPIVLIAVFIEQPTPFLEEFLDKLYHIEYPREKLHLFVHNSAEFHAELVEDFLSQHGEEYRTIKRINPSHKTKESEARSLAINYCLTVECEYYLNLDSDAHLDNPHALRLLIEQNRSVVAPLLLRPYKAWSNFWGALTADGFYARSMDYMEIIHNDRRGVWNVPYVNSCYLIKGALIRHPELKPSYMYNQLDADMAFCTNMREKDVFMYVTNRVDFGHLVNADNFDTSRVNSEIYQLLDNRWDWEQRYLHENYTENFNPNNTIAQPCPDVYWFPVVNPRFCKEFIEIMEHYGQWSDGTNKDPRLDGGYENVPTRDIHMKQVGLEAHWLEVLRLYVRPLQELVFTGYFHDPPRAFMNFVVRYRPEEQPSLRPHHDSSTYTINVALNRPKIDYEGGGCRFIRYNCSVTDTRLGWMLMHPGRLTHYHEGLPVTKGTRYIMISFVDP
ncbi:Procollagen-lysine,2-oxoglutarate 5-dioxygenase 3 [Cryptotermes secundus]|uniref:procollagen-lysine 5-dioxygenase n=1 Tax=Cryptotermes secundus TaxID=105785 RepID=A0A2J7RR31_9NEOP|nr:procollagen-lysine,2-oxoglutarate 5-dioxygenase 1 isoform X3 [Cryptotermes secundus]PNF43292.1 Procollagen-lysine,2-oxoglutarate 5-dioxygenase 3 [Cryptotermes secundus]